MPIYQDLKKLAKTRRLVRVSCTLYAWLFEARNAFGTSLGNYYSNEFYASVAYSRKLTDKFSMGLNLKYINSNLGGGVQVAGGAALKAGTHRRR